MGKIFLDEELEEGVKKLKAVCEAEGIEGEVRIRGIPVVVGRKKWLTKLVESVRKKNRTAQSLNNIGGPMQGKKSPGTDDRADCNEPFTITNAKIGDDQGGLKARPGGLRG